MSVFLPQDQAEFDATAALEAELQRGWPEKIALRHWQQCMWYEIPYYFLPAFPTIVADQIRPLACFGRLMANVVFLHDRLADHAAGVEEVTTVTLRIMAMQFEAFRLLQPVFPASAPFWDRFRAYLADYAWACTEERSFASRARSWRDYSEELVLRVAVGKSGVSRAIIAGLVEHARDDRLLERLAQAIDHFNVAYQMWDDLNDWREDLVSQTPSLLLTRVCPDWALPSEPGAQKLEMDRIGRELYYGGHAGYVLERALSLLDAAEVELRGQVRDLPWFALVESQRRKCRATLSDVDRIVFRNLERRKHMETRALSLRWPEERGPWQRAAASGVRFLVHQWRLGFGEARELFQDASGALHPPTGAECSFGDVFQRALVVDALCEADSDVRAQLVPLLDDEVRYLIGRRCTTGVGGWTYFHELPELPPDTDVLAQVLQALLRSGHREAALEHGEKPLAVLLRDGVLPDGSLKTWIIPAGDWTPAETRQAEMVARLGAESASVEVVANLLYALLLLDADRYDEVILRGAAAIEGRQRASGGWSGERHTSDYYATYVCVRLLAARRVGSRALERAWTFVRDTQRADGGWGSAPERSDALGTALALLCLAEVDAGRADAARARRALSYLEAARDEEGAWPSQELVRLGRARGHGSRTLTTAWVTKASATWQRLTEIYSDREPSTSTVSGSPEVARESAR